MLFKIVLSVLFSTLTVEKPVDKVLLTCGNLMINVSGSCDLSGHCNTNAPISQQTRS